MSKRNPLKKVQPGLPTGKRAARDAVHIRALLLRIKGKLFREIADELGFHSEQAARAAVESGLRKAGLEAVADARKLHVLRLEHYLEVLEPSIEQGKPAAVTAAIAALRRSGALQALDPSVNAPAAVQVNLVAVSGGQPKVVRQLDDGELNVALDFAHSQGLRFLPTVEVGGERVAYINPEEITEVDIEEEKNNEG
jgi:hypothetical protein